MDWLVLALFIACLIGCVLQGISVVWALAAGYVIFFAYGLYCHLTAGELLRVSWRGLRTVRTILVVMVLIGMLTTAWRAGGTLPMIVALAGQVIRPDAFIVLAFILNCLVSVLTGTSFGTVATMGVICMSVSQLLAVSPVLTGGAVMSGAFFGDRCSPLSTSALLVATVTRTNIFHNLVHMARHAVVPFVLCCLIYTVLGWHQGGGTVNLVIQDLFWQYFDLNGLTLVPALVIIAFSLFKIDVRKTLAVSIVISLVLAVWLQGMDIGVLLPMLISGYHIASPELAPMLNGGGIVTMVPSIAIIALSATYAGIFERTDLLHRLRGCITRLAKVLNPFGCIWVVSCFISMISCAQTLAVILTNQLCRDVLPEKENMMIALEDTVIVSAALIPWCIAAAVPLATMEAPVLSLAAAVYLYIQPLYSWFTFGRKGW